MCLPGKMSKLGVNRAGYNFCVDLPELLHPVTEGYDFCGAHKCAAINNIQLLYIREIYVLFLAVTFY